MSTSPDSKNDKLAPDVLRDPLSLFDIDGDVVLIAGASGTFGRACALALASLGAKLMLASGNDSELKAVAEEVAGTGADVKTIVGRAETLQDAERMVRQTIDAFGKLDKLVVASGLNKAAFIQDQSPDDWQAVLKANVMGPWLLAKAVGTWFIDNSVKGKVLFVSSVRGRHGNYSGYGAYCTSKGALDSLTRVLATEWGKYGITVNAIAPTVFRSKLTEWMWSDDEVGIATRKRSFSRIPLGRLANVEDLIGMAVYLLAPASDFCTGQIMYIDGGYTAS